MFGETLIESSPASRKNKRWPMATAFTLETILAGIAVIIPLLSTGVIPLSARVSAPVPLQRFHPVERVAPEPFNHSGTAAPASRQIVTVSDNQNAIHIGRSLPVTTDVTEVPPNNAFIGNDHALDNLTGPANTRGPTVRRETTRVVSVNCEAQLVNRVEPVYPRIAVTSGIQGEVRLHAIIGRDGKIMSLNVISGHPFLVHAAEDAVSQWRYRPYYLNGQAVEVETFITVNFRKEMR